MIDTSPYNDLTYDINGAAMEVHNVLGPGFPEKVYQEALLIALKDRKIPAVKEVGFAVEFQGQTVGEFRVDVLVDEAVILELKAVDRLVRPFQENNQSTSPHEEWLKLFPSVGTLAHRFT